MPHPESNSDRLKRASACVRQACTNLGPGADESAIEVEAVRLMDSMLCCRVCNIYFFQSDSVGHKHPEVPRLPEVGESLAFDDGRIWRCIAVSWKTRTYEKPDRTTVELSNSAVEYTSGWRVLPAPEVPTRFDRL